MAQSILQTVSAETAKLHIEQLIQYALEKLMLERLDVSDTRNQLLALFQFSEPSEDKPSVIAELQPVLDALIDYGYSIGLIEENTINFRDLLDARIMGLLLPKPSQVVAAFEKKASDEGVEAATEQFYQFNQDSNYIRMDRIAKNVEWLYESDYGKLEMTINLSKPEKDPKEIAKLRSLPQAHYPKCPLCPENVGYAGRLNHPARQNLRIVPIELQQEKWFFQYSPYVYYNEHSIVFKEKHEPMVISHSSFARLLDFTEQFRHYFIGSNADLPIVGGSILSHDHFQAGKHVFPMEQAPIEAMFVHPELSGVRFGIVRWPMSVVRVSGANKEQVWQAACGLLDQWRTYSDEAADVLAFSKDSAGNMTPHNTITPIARLNNSKHYELDLVLRNNRTSAEHPDGIYHPHQEHHHIKKENIGLIEVMGLAVLPGRLKEELEQLTKGLMSDEAFETIKKNEALAYHIEWLEQLRQQHGTSLSAEQAKATIFAETGRKFQMVLQDAGVFKRTVQGAEAFKRFLLASGLKSV